MIWKFLVVFVLSGLYGFATRFWVYIDYAQNRIVIIVTLARLSDLFRDLVPAR
jgi:hypothetical protein